MRASMKIIKCAILLLILVRGAGSTSPGVVSCPSSGSKVIQANAPKTSNYTLFAPGTSNSPANTGIVYWGGPNVTTSSTCTPGATGTCGFPLIPGSSYTSPAQGGATPYSMGNIYIACTVNTDILVYVYQ